jgi:DNA-binding transcriptional ArsR family regulator
MSDDVQPRQQHRQISDAQTMRALAHPTRIALLDLLRRDGDLTATRAAEVLGDSPGNMSWHLQTLAKYGFVEESGNAKGRSRPWRLASVRNRFITPPDDPEALAAGDALVMQFIDRAVSMQRDWLEAHDGYSKEWQDAAFLSNSLTYLTAEELADLSTEITELFARHHERVDNRIRPDGALPVHLTAFGHPLPPTEAGN